MSPRPSSIRRALLLVASALAASAPAAPAPAAPAEPPGAPEPVATWKGGVVHRHELESWLRFQRLEGEPEDLRAAVEVMVWVEFLARAAEERGAGRRPEMARTLERAEEEALVAALRQDRSERVEVRGEDVTAFLAEHPDLLLRPRKKRLRNVYKRFPAGATEEEKEALRVRMAAIRAELEAGADFAAVAERESDSQTRFRKGILGNLAAGQLRPEIDAAAAALAPGELSAVLETEDGLTLLRCDQVFEAHEPAPAEQRREAAAHLRRQAVRQDWQDFTAELLRSARPAFDLQAARGAGAEAVVARFEGGRLSRAELTETLRSRPVKRLPGDLEDGALRAVLEELVVRRLAAREARRRDLDQDPEVRQQLAWQRRQVLAADELRRRVDAEFEPPSEQQVRAWFEANRDEFRRPAHYDLELLRITLTEGEERRRYGLAAELEAGLSSGELDFAAAARAHSDHPSAGEGGALGWMSGRQVAGLGPNVLKTVKALEPGETSRLVQQDRSLYLVRLRGRQEPRPLTWEEAAERASTELGSELVQEIQARIEARLRPGLEVRLAASP